MKLHSRNTTTADETPVGYVSAGSGGYFFTWNEAMQATVASIEKDRRDPPTGRHSLSTIQRMVRVAWREQAEREKDGCIPIWDEGLYRSNNA